MSEERKSFLDDYPEVLNPKEIQEILRIGRRQTYELLNQNMAPFHTIRIGRRILIPKLEFKKWFYGENNDEKEKE